VLTLIFSYGKKTWIMLEKMLHQVHAAEMVFL